MNKYRKILFYYCFLISLFISISGILSTQNTSQLLFQLIFLPVTLYFSYSVLVQVIDKKDTVTKDKKTNGFAVFIAIVFFSFLLTISLIRVAKNPVKTEKS